MGVDEMGSRRNGNILKRNGIQRIQNEWQTAHHDQTASLGAIVFAAANNTLLS